MLKFMKAILLSMAGVFLVSSVYAQDAQEKRYITPPEYAENVYFGDAHIHTRISIDSGLWGNTLGPRHLSVCPRWRGDVLQGLDSEAGTATGLDGHFRPFRLVWILSAYRGWR